jgi:hypothetical protein
MSFDDVLIVIVVGGIALSAAYIRSEYILWRSRGAAERRRAAILGELHAARLSQHHGGLLDPNIAQLQIFAETEAAISEDIPNERRSARSSSQRNYPFVERRTRQKRHATH